MVLLMVLRSGVAWISQEGNVGARFVDLTSIVAINYISVVYIVEQIESM